MASTVSGNILDSSCTYTMDKKIKPREKAEGSVSFDRGAFSEHPSSGDLHAAVAHWRPPRCSEGRTAPGSGGKAGAPLLLTLARSLQPRAPRGMGAALSEAGRRENRALPAIGEVCP